MEKIPGSHNGESSTRDSFGDDFPNPSDHGEVKTGSFVFLPTFNRTTHIQNWRPRFDDIAKLANIYNSNVTTV
jgi:hypothetical protein